MVDVGEAVKVDDVGELFADKVDDGVVDANDMVDAVLVVLVMLTSRKCKHFLDVCFSGCRVNTWGVWMNMFEDHGGSREDEKNVCGVATLKARSWERVNDGELGDISFFQIRFRMVVPDGGEP
jgi:hypothetical protein